MLHDKWYDTVVKSCNLNPKTFQLVQGSMVVGNTSEFLWNLMDAIPPASTHNLYNSSGGNLFSSNYGAIISHLVPDSLVMEARELWKEAGGFSAAKAYNKTIADLQSAIKRGRPVSFTMDSSTEPEDLAPTTTEQQGNVSSESSSTVIDVEFKRLITFSIAPLSKKSDLDPTLARYEPWYISSVLARAYGKRGEKFWEKPMRKSFFGPDGTMLRVATSLVVVDGITSETRSNAQQTGHQSFSFGTDDEFERGFSPFVNLLRVLEPRSNTSFSTASSGKVSISSPKGIPVILGVNVTPIEDFV